MLDLANCVQSDLDDDPPSQFTVPINVLPHRKKVAWIWICCACGHGGMKVSAHPCEACGTPRCPNCNTRRYNLRN
ncbi:hypothetical protein DER45DRAFT_558127 [Fusarium avenaceum]|nr:hypothetical protein DER45DRAFT_558127 [Fusarium avenaceum]